MHHAYSYICTSSCLVIHHQTQTTVHTQDLTVPETSSKSSSRQQIRQQGRQKTTHTHTIDNINSDSCPAPACVQRSLSGNHFQFIKNLKKYASQLCDQIPLLLYLSPHRFKQQQHKMSKSKRGLLQ